MNRAERITSILTKNLRPSYLDLRDDSAKHAGHAGAAPGGETHYHLVIASEKFNGLGRVQCHQLVYSLLDSEFKSGLHALSIEAKNI